MKDPSLSTLIVGLIRPLVWVVGAYICTRYKNWFALVGCICFVPTAIASSFLFAGFQVPTWMTFAAPYLSTPGCIFMVGGMALSARNMRFYWREIDKIKAIPTDTLDSSSREED